MESKGERVSDGEGAWRLGDSERRGSRASEGRLVGSVREGRELTVIAAVPVASCSCIVDGGSEFLASTTMTKFRPASPSRCVLLLAA